ncbi:MAG: glycoside hydrolase family 3 C-terminal domain-containing protein, partial [Solirubrobacteraceae bacterium]
VGAQDSEGVDRSTMDLNSGNCTLAGCTPQSIDQDQLIAQVAAANPHTVVVLNTGGPVLMPWLGQVQGLFEAWYPGQEDGNAIAALLYGDVNPSAKLPETFPRSQTDLPTQSATQYPGVNDAQGVPQSQYSEGLLVGYRWYDARHIAPLFPFGYGLSYTSFDYGPLQITASRSGPTVATASLAVTNTGQRSGADIPQLYIAAPAATGEPPKQLKGFARVDLAAGQTKQASFPIDDRALSYWSTNASGWRAAPGCYAIMIGHDELDIVRQATVAVNGAHCPGAVASITTDSVPPPRCPAPQGRLSGSRLGPVALGMTRARVRRTLRGRAHRGRRDMDFFCLAGGGGIRAGYPSRRLLAELPRGVRRRVQGRAVLLLTANRHYALGVVRPGQSAASARHHLKLGRGLHVGRNTWYLTSSRGSRRGVLRVQGGRVREIGITERRLTAGSAAARRLLASFS